MEKKNRADVASRFAENLIAQMLQRSGTEFHHLQDSQLDESADFVVQDGKEILYVEVKYTDSATQARDLWKHWLHSSSATQQEATKSTHKTTHKPLHLVVVTGTGDIVFTDPILAPMLLTDYRTKLSVLD